jgi:hypothetical protein
MNFVMHRNKTVASSMGLSIEFVKGVAQHVPPYMYKEVLAHGGVPEDELTEEELNPGNSNEPREPEDRKAALFVAFDKIVLRNEREEFTAGGTPNTGVLTRELGWTVNAKERDAAWQEFKIKGSE